jgi:DNA repair protein RecN (Recombination protein N)
MLSHLSITDFVIVERLDLEFCSGFTALTGETGAGKSILLDALALALGDRAEASVVRTGAERAEIVAEFQVGKASPLNAWLREMAFEDDAGQVMLRRVIDRNGRSRGFINGSQATLVQMRTAGEWLLDIHGQHEHQSLMKPEAQRELLDGHAGLLDLARDVSAAYRQWQRLAHARAEHETNAAARDAEREQVAWQVEELARIAVKPGEWESVQTEHSRLSHSASLIEGTQWALESLSEGERTSMGTLSGVAAKLKQLAQVDAGLVETQALLDSAQAQLQEAIYALRHYADRLDLDPARLADVGARLEAIHAAARKYRCDAEELPGRLESLQGRLAELELASDLGALVEQEQAAFAAYRAISGKLSAGRKKAALKLSKDVTAAMKSLAMGEGLFQVVLNPAQSESSAHGDEQIEFQVAANPGVEPRALAKVASGGELSRISLAIQVVASKAAAVPTLIFDEVDAGIGGAVAEVVGRKLKALGESRQVLCVTHLAQVAAQADQQWSVAKHGDKGVVKSAVTVLDKAGRIDEIARMLGGMSITATTRKHAEEMLGKD